MKFKVKTRVVSTISKYLILTPDDCEKLGVGLGGRVYATGPKGSITMFVSTTRDVLKPGEVIISAKNSEIIGISDGDTVDVVFVSAPAAVSYVRKKIDGKRLTKDEIAEVIEDIQNENLTYEEVAIWLTALRTRGMDAEEISYVAMALANLNNRIQYGRAPIFDFQSMNGVAGNKISPIVVSIVAAAGFTISNASPHALTNACGIADMMSTVCNVMLTASETKKVVDATNGCFASTKPMNVMADYYMAFIENKLGIYIRPLMIASILGKKLLSGVTCALIEVPTGAGTYAETIEDARAFMTEFVETGKKLGIHVESVITQGDTPVGNAIGPVLEAKEVLEVLEGRGSDPSVSDKACEMAGIILEMAGIFNGREMAYSILGTGKALEKFREIVKAQEGNGNVKSEDLRPGKYVCEIKSKFNGEIEKIDNDRIKTIAKTAGSPTDKGAGILLMRKKTDVVSKGDVLFRIYAEDERKLREAEKMAESIPPVSTGHMILERIGGKKVRP